MARNNHSLFNVGDRVCVASVTHEYIGVVQSITSDVVELSDADCTLLGSSRKETHDKIEIQRCLIVHVASKEWD